ncbi:outer membrane beta-barrel protein [Hymenobacter negativus]|uniref:PorT family protein n=1 Tax=Hymenobacter negativus TaxID=2795026 RepID=A0ABS3QMR7_9BACT|nr:outer membrane beta-barrel protein [Hymenobacter negativus]MBO2012568.1 PorT family protein [Hymenobacter negativus]
MQRAFLSFFLLLLVLLGGPTVARATALAASTASYKDTIVVRLPNQATLTLVVRDAAQLRQMKNYQLDSLTSRLASYITQAEKAAQGSSTNQVTLQFYPDKDQPGKNLPEQIRITTRKKEVNTNRVDVVLNKAFGVTVTTDEKGNKSYNTVDVKTKEQRQAHRDSVRMKDLENRSTKSHLIFDLGLNTLVNQKTAAGQSDVDLRTEGSRYVNIGLDWDIRLGGKHSPMSLTVGPEFAFNNYMLNGNQQWVNENGRTSIILNREGRQYQKTKLATSSINLPLMLRLQLHDSHYKPTFTIGAGGFVGYRLKSWTKVKYTSEGTTYKDHEEGSYNMENFQYGLQATIGYRDLEFFGKYNMNPLFKTNAGPDTQVLSFGLRLVGIN